MQEPEWVAFLRHGTRTGKLSVNLPSGHPTVTPIWFLYEDDGIIRFNSWHDSAKVRSLRMDPRAALLVELEEPPYAYVRIRATAHVLDDLRLTRRVATDVGGRYMGPDRAEEYGARNGVPGEVVVELTPTKVTAVHDIST